MTSQEDLLRMRAEKKGQQEVRAQQEADAAGVQKLVGSADPALMEMAGALRGCFWRYQKRVLDAAEMAIPSDRQWTIARRVMQDAQTEQLQMMVAIARAAYMQLKAQLEEQQENQDAEV